MKTIIKNIVIIILGIAAFVFLMAEGQNTTQTFIAKAIAVVFVFAIVCLHDEPKRVN